MSEIVAKKVGIVSCSGEELPEGTISRLAALKILSELRPNHTVTICLPLFLAGGAGDRAFAKLHPTITIDGCDLRCAARATEKYSTKPAASLVVSEIASKASLGKLEGRRQLNRAGQEAVRITAEKIAVIVDELIGQGSGAPGSAQSSQSPTKTGQREATCSCGSGVPVIMLNIAGRNVELVALPLVFRRLRDERLAAGKPTYPIDEETANHLFEEVRIYNEVPAGSEPSYRVAVLREYALFSEREGK